MSSSPTPVKTALCLCGGGITGAMYEIGALVALDDFFTRGPGSAPFTVNEFDLYVGTSAGALFSTLLSAGVPARRMFRSMLENDRHFLPANRTDIYRFDVSQGLGVVRDVGAIVLSAMARGLRGRLNLGDLVSGIFDVLPAGVFSLKHYEKFLSDTFERLGVPSRFADIQRELYVTANDLDSGHRAIFGQGALADIPISKAICASSAIPLFFEPVRWRGRDYIDGAVGKVEHADIALARGAELIVIINPLAPFRNDPDREQMPDTPLVGARYLRDKGMLAVYNQAGRMSTRTKLHQGIRRYRASHPQTNILLIEPRDDEGDMFRDNPMSFSSRQRVIRYGYESAARQLREQRAVYEAAFGKLDVRVDPKQLQAPWELTG
jgi:NTE family protein